MPGKLQNEAFELIRLPLPHFPLGHARLDLLVCVNYSRLGLALIVIAWEANDGQRLQALPENGCDLIL